MINNPVKAKAKMRVGRTTSLALKASWSLAGGGLHLLANLSDVTASLGKRAVTGEQILSARFARRRQSRPLVGDLEHMSSMSGSLDEGRGSKARP